MPRSCKTILDNLLLSHKISKKDYDKLKKNITSTRLRFLKDSIQEVHDFFNSKYEDKCIEDCEDPMEVFMKGYDFGFLEALELALGDIEGAINPGIENFRKF